MSRLFLPQNATNFSEMHGGSGRREVGGDRFRIPAFSMKSNNGASALNGVFDLRKSLEAPGARRIGTAGKKQFDGLGTGASAKLHEADGGNLMRVKVGIFSMQINYF